MQQNRTNFSDYLNHFSVSWHEGQEGNGSLASWQGKRAGERCRKKAGTRARKGKGVWLRGREQKGRTWRTGTRTRKGTGVWLRGREIGQEKGAGRKRALGPRREREIGFVAGKGYRRKGQEKAAGEDCCLKGGRIVMDKVKREETDKM